MNQESTSLQVPRMSVPGCLVHQDQQLEALGHGAQLGTSADGQAEHQFDLPVLQTARRTGANRSGKSRNPWCQNDPKEHLSPAMTRSVANW